MESTGMLLIDEVVGHDVQVLGPAKISKPTITVRELLKLRVELEWRATEGHRQKHLQQAEHIAERPEALLNATSRSYAKRIFSNQDGCNQRKLDRKYATVEEAFLNQRIFVLLDHRQAEMLDEVVQVERTAAVTFLLLTPLRGG